MKMKKLISFLCAAALTVSSFAGLAVTASAETPKSVTVAVDAGDTTANVTTTESSAVTGVLLLAKYSNNALTSLKVSTSFTTPANDVALGAAYADGDKLMAWEDLASMKPITVTRVAKPVPKTAVNTVAELAVTATNNSKAPATITAAVTAKQGAEFTDTNAFTYTWTKDGVDANTTGAIIENAAAGTYTVTATYNGTGNYEGSLGPVSITIQAADDTRTNLSTATVTVTPNENVVTGTALTAAVTIPGAEEGDPATTVPAADLDYAWSKKGDSDAWTPVADATAATFTPTDAGTYKVTVTAKAASEDYVGTKDSAEVAVAKAPTVITPDATYVSFTKDGDVDNTGIDYRSAVAANDGKLKIGYAKISGGYFTANNVKWDDQANVGIMSIDASTYAGKIKKATLNLGVNTESNYNLNVRFAKTANYINIADVEENAFTATGLSALTGTIDSSNIVVVGQSTQAGKDIQCDITPLLRGAEDGKVTIGLFTDGGHSVFVNTYTVDIECADDDLAAAAVKVNQVYNDGTDTVAIPTTTETADGINWAAGDVYTTSMAAAAANGTYGRKTFANVIDQKTGDPAAKYVYASGAANNQTLVAGDNTINLVYNQYKYATATFTAKVGTDAKAGVPIVISADAALTDGTTYESKTVTTSTDGTISEVLLPGAYKWTVEATGAYEGANGTFTVANDGAAVPVAVNLTGKTQTLTDVTLDTSKLNTGILTTSQATKNVGTISSTQVDETGVAMATQQAVTYSVTPADKGVSISSAGVVTITNETPAGDYVIKATAGGVTTKDASAYTMTVAATGTETVAAWNDDFEGETNMFGASKAASIAASAATVYTPVKYGGWNGNHALVVSKATATASTPTITLDSNDTVLIKYREYNGWFTNSETNTVTVKSGSKELVSYTYNVNNCNITDVKINGTTASGFVAFHAQSNYNGSGDANGWEQEKNGADNKSFRYFASETYNPVVEIKVKGDGSVEFNHRSPAAKSNELLDHKFTGNIGEAVTNVDNITITSTISNSGRASGIDNVTTTITRTAATPEKVALTGVTLSSNAASDAAITVGTVLTATIAPANATGVTYEWYRGEDKIDGATAATYTVTAADQGKNIKVVATDNADTPNSFNATKAIPAAAPTKTDVTAATAAITKNGTTLTASVSGVTPEAAASAFTQYAWSRSTTEDGTYTAVAGLTNTITAEEGYFYKVTISIPESNETYNTYTATSAPVEVPVPPAPTVTVNTAKVANAHDNAETNPIPDGEIYSADSVAITAGTEDNGYATYAVKVDDLKSHTAGNGMVQHWLGVVLTLANVDNDSKVYTGRVAQPASGNDMWNEDDTVAGHLNDPNNPTEFSQYANLDNVDDETSKPKPLYIVIENKNGDDFKFKFTFDEVTFYSETPAASATVSAATIHDTRNESTDEATKAAAIADNDLATGYAVTENNGAVTVNAKNLKEHRNGDTPTSMGYWVGVKFTFENVTAGAKVYYKALAEAPADAAALKATADVGEGALDADDIANGWSIYTNAAKYQTGGDRAGQKLYVAIEGIDKLYAIDFSQVTLYTAATPAATVSTATVTTSTSETPWKGHSPNELGTFTVKSTEEEGYDYELVGTANYIADYSQAFGTEDGVDMTKGYYIPFSIDIPDTVADPTKAVLTYKSDAATKTYTYNSFTADDRNCTVILYLNPNATFFTYTIDWDGEGEAFTAKTYKVYIDQSGTSEDIATKLYKAPQPVTNYTITIPTGLTGGSVAVTAPNDYNAETGVAAETNVVITATPSEGYQLKALTVKNGDETVEDTDGADNTTYTFSMPAGNVTVSAEFEEIAPLADRTPDGSNIITYAANATQTVKDSNNKSYTVLTKADVINLSSELKQNFNKIYTEFDMCLADGDTLKVRGQNSNAGYFSGQLVFTAADGTISVKTNTSSAGDVAYGSTTLETGKWYKVVFNATYTSNSATSAFDWAAYPITITNGIEEVGTTAVVSQTGLTARNIGAKEYYAVQLDASGSPKIDNCFIYTDHKYSATVTVTDGTNPIEGATVTLDNAARSTATTNASGTAEFTITEGAYTATVEKSGYIAPATAPTLTVAKDGANTAAAVMTAKVKTTLTVTAPESKEVIAGDENGITYSAVVTDQENNAMTAEEAPVAWSVFDSTGTTEISDQIIAVSNGKITATSSAVAGTYTVKAVAGGNTTDYTDTFTVKNVSPATVTVNYVTTANDPETAIATETIDSFVGESIDLADTTNAATYLSTIEIKNTDAGTFKRYTIDAYETDAYKIAEIAATNTINVKVSTDNKDYFLYKDFEDGTLTPFVKQGGSVGPVLIENDNATVNPNTTKFLGQEHGTGDVIFNSGAITVGTENDVLLEADFRFDPGNDGKTSEFGLFGNKTASNWFSGDANKEIFEITGLASGNMNLGSMYINTAANSLDMTKVAVSNTEAQYTDSKNRNTTGWLHLNAVVHPSTEKVDITITRISDSTEIVKGTYDFAKTGSYTGDLYIYMHHHKSYGGVSLDNVKVSIAK